MLDSCGIETKVTRVLDQDPTRVAIDARWLWDRDNILMQLAKHWRSMLDGCGIETVAHAAGTFLRAVGSRRAEQRPLHPRSQDVAIDARCLWNRDRRSSARKTPPTPRMLDGL
jgi:hypothetical protein